MSNTMPAKSTVHACRPVTACLAPVALDVHHLERHCCVLNACGHRKRRVKAPLNPSHHTWALGRAPVCVWKSIVWSTASFAFDSVGYIDQQYLMPVEASMLPWTPSA